MSPATYLQSQMTGQNFKIINVQKEILNFSDQNWWRGTTSRGMCGLFPASFVTTDLKDPMPQIEAQMPTQNDEKTTEIDGENGGPNGAKVQIDENVLLKCIELIEGLDPAMDGSMDPPELAFLENMAMAQAPLIDQKLMQIDKVCGRGEGGRWKWRARQCRPPFNSPICNSIFVLLSN